MKIKYDSHLMKVMTFFESLTHAPLKDCFLPPTGGVVFVVREGKIAQAIGREGVMVKRLSKALQKKVKIVEYNDDPVRFLAGLISPVKARSLAMADGVITITCNSVQDRGGLIGRNAVALRNYETVMQRYFDVKEIRVE